MSAPARFALAALLSASAPAFADIYECRDAAGPRYTDVREEGCVLLIKDTPHVEAPIITTRHQARKELQPAIHAAAKRHQVSPSLLEALIQVESGFRQNAVSVKGAMGLTQLMPATAQMLGVRNAFDPGANIEGGARHLRDLLNRYQGDARLALAAYNAGVGAVERYGSVPPFRETQDYVSRVTRLQREFAGRASAQ